MSFSWQIALKTLERLAFKIMTWIQLHYTTPELSWESALKMTKVQLELLGDIDMHLMIEKGYLCFTNQIIQ